MRLTYIRATSAMTVRELLRSRIALVLLFVIPTLFYALIMLTTTNRTIAFKLASVSEEVVVEVSERSESLIFVGLAAVGLLTSFLAMNLVQKHAEVNRRLVLSGYKPSELIVGKFAVLLGVIILIALYVGALLLLFDSPKNFPLVIFGFALGGYVYGTYGLLVGSLFKRELEGILLIVLLANIDAGWLQNPIYYAEAQSKWIIRHLPAYFPSQMAMVAAFTDQSVWGPLTGSLVYGSIFLIVALFVYFRRMRIQQ